MPLLLILILVAVLALIAFATALFPARRKLLWQIASCSAALAEPAFLSHCLFSGIVDISPPLNKVIIDEYADL